MDDWYMNKIWNKNLIRIRNKKEEWKNVEQFNRRQTNREKYWKTARKDLMNRKIVEGFYNKKEK